MPDDSLNYQLNTRVTTIHPTQKLVTTSAGEEVFYDILVLATGSDALLPRNTPGYDAKGVFVYRTIDDLQKLIGVAKSLKSSTLDWKRQKQGWILRALAVSSFLSGTNGC